MIDEEREVVYLGRDNAVDLQLLANGSPIDLSAATRYELADVNCGWTLDSSVSAEAFDDSLGEGKIILKLGDQDIPLGDQTAWLIVYDPSNLGGVVWGQVKLTVVNICAS